MGAKMKNDSKALAASCGVPGMKRKTRNRRRRDQPLPRRPPLTKEQQDLAADYMPLARALAKRFKDAWAFENDEFESAACLALVEAAQSYDASKNVKFATYARK